LRELAQTGNSASKIADALNQEFGAGLTRSAVIGRCHRIAEPLSGKSSRPGPPCQPYKRPPKLRRPPPKTPSNSVQLPKIPPPPPCTLLELTQERCRWPIGEPRELLYCGAPAISCYCEQHDAIAFNRNPRPRGLNVRSWRR
jgi:GcrA cell cycle regulator